MGPDNLVSPTPPPPPQPQTPPSASGGVKTTALAPGFRFHPTDEELCSYYLKRKVSNKPVRFNAIAEVDIYKNEPWELADKSRLKSRDQEWYFFSALDKKYGNGARMNRATLKGYWKATGKDREVRRGSQLIAMKKTLVFHSGRAPGGQRTNWVMHEYRLVEEELERLRTFQTDSFVLCRVFHKNNIGPPNGNRYAPFLEEEWDDGQAVFVPGEDVADDVLIGPDNAEKNHIEQDNHSLIRKPLNINELPKESQTPDELREHDLSVCKTETMDDCPACVLNTEASLLNTDPAFPLLQYKRRRTNTDFVANPSNGSGNSTRTTQDPCSSTTSTGATTTTDTTVTAAAATTTAVSALLEFSLMESIEPKESAPVPATAAAPASTPSFENFGLASTVPPSCMKFINDLQTEIHRISVERETLRLEMMSAQAMINILQSRIEFVTKENDDLKRCISSDNKEASMSVEGRH